ncbi:MAG: hypothetical protein S4CHLAM81_12500 [Chlamydiales bacterium]|nr:hypothetical protein [Chlamydiales bacterium]MCH9636025.1 hypothetical protein [Chlamydiales bacterium]MCH9703597.1 hypothetical protein [Chlamydiota bacterium]
MQAVIYVGEGVDLLLMRQIASQMASRPKKVGRHFFLSPNWEEEVDLVIIPGGRDLPYHNHLKGEANSRIRRFVENGGNYLGICAGAYYGASEVLFEEGGPLEVIGKRELSFFNGKAVGPALGKGQFAYGSERGAKEVSLEWANGQAPAYYNGGCYFDGKDAEVIAHYEEINLPAIVCCQVGSGRAILSGVHLECEVQDDAPRRALWDHLMSLIKF